MKKMGLLQCLSVFCPNKVLIMGLAVMPSAGSLGAARPRTTSNGSASSSRSSNSRSVSPSGEGGAAKTDSAPMSKTVFIATLEKYIEDKSPAFAYMSFADKEKIYLAWYKKVETLPVEDRTECIELLKKFEEVKNLSCKTLDIKEIEQSFASMNMGNHCFMISGIACLKLHPVLFGSESASSYLNRINLDGDHTVTLAGIQLPLDNDAKMKAFRPIFFRNIQKLLDPNNSLDSAKRMRKIGAIRKAHFEIFGEASCLKLGQSGDPAEFIKIFTDCFVPSPDILMRHMNSLEDPSEKEAFLRSFGCGLRRDIRRFYNDAESMEIVLHEEIKEEIVPLIRQVYSGQNPRQEEVVDANSRITGEFEVGDLSGQEKKDYHQVTSVEHPISAPLRQIIRNPYAATENKLRDVVPENLMCMVVHETILGGGHYTTYIRGDKNTWFHVNDLLVTKVDMAKPEILKKINHGAVLVF